MFARKILRYLNNDFNKNFITLFSGSTLAQLIPLAASVLLARLYSPADFGILAIFSSLVLIFTSVVNLRYEFAIPLAKADVTAVFLVLLGGIVAIFFSILLFVVFFLFKHDLLVLINGKSLGNWIFLVPVAVLFSGFYNCLKYFTLRFDRYRMIAGSNIVRSASKSGIQVALGFLGMGQMGLILGNALSTLFGNVQMLKEFLKYKVVILNVVKSDLLTVARRYRKFPLVSIWGVFLNSVALNINNFVIPSLFGVVQLGFYSYSFKYINAPLSLISTNMGQLFYQVCANKQRENKTVGKEFISTLLKLVVICMPVFTILYFFIEELFVFAFGEKWRIAGFYAHILIPFFFVRTIYGPLSRVSLAFEKQYLTVLMQMIILLTNVLIFFWAYLTGSDIISFLNVYTFFGVCVYVVLTILSYFVALRKI